MLLMSPSLLKFNRDWDIPSPRQKMRSLGQPRYRQHGSHASSSRGLEHKCSGHRRPNRSETFRHSGNCRLRRNTPPRILCRSGKGDSRRLPYRSRRPPGRFRRSHPPRPGYHLCAARFPRAEVRPALLRDRPLTNCECSNTARASGPTSNERNGPIEDREMTLCLVPTNAAIRPCCALAIAWRCARRASGLNSGSSSH